ncbi:heat shock protein beta-9 [Salarias fasciatus]|uniref:Uncharacterized LOC115385564 n=1 Tax=Salarias fasciatus TaxID=181472 RepID=A0A672I736_SALFA|nr:uncharacterized protein LOC115385564 [Salarias fasciatus]
MMSQHGGLAGLFGDDPFFAPSRLLWPLDYESVSSLQQDFFQRRAGLADSLLRELHDGPRLLKLGPLPLASSPLARLSDDPEQQASGSDLQPVTHGNNSDLLVTLDARGYAPGDITVKLEGRRLAVAAMKQAGAEESQACSSASSRAAFHSSASAQTGFVQKIDLPAHLDLSGLSCSLMDNGQLRIHAPAARQPAAADTATAAATATAAVTATATAAEEEQPVPVRFRTSLEFPLNKDNTEEKHTD